ncbi:MAG: SH3 domain-containing protein [Candidatus Tectimicrobiota bacterium]
MVRRSVSAFALLVAVAFLFPPPLLAAKAIVWVKEKSNVRSGPGTKYEKLWTATKFTPLEVLCRYKEWYVVRDFEDFVGWVHAPLVEEGKAVIVKVKQALARSGPGPDQAAVWNVPKGYALRVLGKKGKWYNVEDAEGEKAWIFEDVLWGSTD